MLAMAVSERAETASRRSAIWGYGIAALAVLAALILRLAFDPILGKRSPFLFFPLAILLAARFGGWIPGLAAAVLSTLGGWYFLIDPPHSFILENKQDAENLAAVAISATAISLLGSQLRDSLISKTKSERAAQQSETTVRALLDSAAQAILAVDTSGNIVTVNGMTESIFGYERAELLGRSLDILLPEETQGRHREHQKDYFANPQNRPMGLGLEVEGRRKNGVTFPAEVSLSHIETPAGNLAIAFVTDVTQRRHVEEERQKFISLAERTLEFVGMCDLEFRPFYVNRAGMRLVGLDDLEAACRVKVKDYFFPEDLPFIFNDFLPRVLREGHGKVEIRFRHFRTGAAIWMLYNVFGIFDGHGNHIGWATVSVDVTERKRIESNLKESRQELRALAGRLMNAEEEERKRISRELHDDLSQKLALLSFDTASLLQKLPPTVDQMKEQLRDLQTRVVQLSQDVRQISHRLHPSVLEDLGLAAALNELCEEISAREGIEAAFEQDAVPGDLPVNVASCLYRVAQEALHNVLKHAHANQVHLKLRGSSGGIQLSIRDTGAGFDLEEVSLRHGLGIVSMKERVRLVQGEFAIHSQPGRGTEVRILVPLPKEAS
jgi:PAS domain S-box-containing protein